MMRRTISFLALVALICGVPGIVDAAANKSSHRGVHKQRESRTTKYEVGSSIPALKLSRLEMLNPHVGVGIAPLTSNSGRLLRAVLVETKDGAASWTVTGVIPPSFGYPWQTAFKTNAEGYVIGSDGTLLFTENAGKSWAKASTRGIVTSISIDGSEMWATARACPKISTNVLCSEFLEPFEVGKLKPTSVASVPIDTPIIAQVSQTVGYAVGNVKDAGKIFLTANSGVSWRAVTNPCGRLEITGSAVASQTHLFAFCGTSIAPSTEGVELFASIDGGESWSMRSESPTLGLTATASDNGQYVWTFSSGLLATASGGGREWKVESDFKEGPGGSIVTVGADDAWYADIAHGIFRTLNGHSWILLR